MIQLKYSNWREALDLQGSKAIPTFILWVLPTLQFIK